MDKLVTDKKEAIVKNKLDMPSAKSQQVRKQALMEKLLANTQPPKIVKVASSSVLGKAKTFLPKIKKANEKLEESDKKDLAIDNVPKDAKSYVEMDVAMFCSCDSDSDSDSETDSEMEATTDEYDSDTFRPKFMTPSIKKAPMVEILDVSPKEEGF